MLWVVMRLLSKKLKNSAREGLGRLYYLLISMAKIKIPWFLNSFCRSTTWGCFIKRNSKNTDFLVWDKWHSFSTFLIFSPGCIFKAKGWYKGGWHGMMVFVCLPWYFLIEKKSCSFHWTIVLSITIWDPFFSVDKSITYRFVPRYTFNGMILFYSDQIFLCCL